MSLIESPDKINGNGHSRPQLSRKSLMRALPAQLDIIDNRLADNNGRIAELLRRVTALEGRVQPIAARLQRLDRRSLRFRKKLAIVVDHVEEQIE
jgi:hypothetical protein